MINIKPFFLNLPRSFQEISLNKDVGVLGEGFEKLSQTKVIKVKGFNPLIFGIVHRRLLSPITTGKPVGMQVNADKVYEKPP
jgi:hypothetical protein